MDSRDMHESLGAGLHDALIITERPVAQGEQESSAGSKRVGSDRSTQFLTSHQSPLVGPTSTTFRNNMILRRPTLEELEVEVLDALTYLNNELQYKQHLSNIFRRVVRGAVSLPQVQPRIDIVTDFRLQQIRLLDGPEIQQTRIGKLMAELPSGSQSRAGTSSSANSSLNDGGSNTSSKAIWNPDFALVASSSDVRWIFDRPQSQGGSTNTSGLSSERQRMRTEKHRIHSDAIARFFSWNLISIEVKIRHPSRCVCQGMSYALQSFEICGNRIGLTIYRQRFSRVYVEDADTISIEVKDGFQTDEILGIEDVIGRTAASWMRWTIGSPAVSGSASGKIDEVGLTTLVDFIYNVANAYASLTTESAPTVQGVALQYTPEWEGALRLPVTDSQLKAILQITRPKDKAAIENVFGIRDGPLPPVAETLPPGSENIPGQPSEEESSGGFTSTEDAPLGKRDKNESDSERSGADDWKTDGPGGPEGVGSGEDSAASGSANQEGQSNRQMGSGTDQDQHKTHRDYHEGIPRNSEPTDQVAEDTVASEDEEGSMEDISLFNPHFQILKRLGIKIRLRSSTEMNALLDSYLAIKSSTSLRIGAERMSIGLSKRDTQIVSERSYAEDHHQAIPPTDKIRGWLQEVRHAAHSGSA